jgi:hypothetical protein
MSVGCSTHVPLLKYHLLHLQILVKPEGKKPRAMCTRIKKDNIKIYSKEIGYKFLN